jgi:WD40 repeat protein
MAQRICVMTGGTAVGRTETATDAHDDAFEVALPPQPYPGLRPFVKEEWPIFFGREIITVEVIERLIDKQFLALHGDSGCGKSSLIRAGVMPRLERDHARGGTTWRTSSMLPRNAPLRNLATALAALDPPTADSARVTELRRTLNLGTKAAPHLSKQLRRGDNDYVCILVDQFEEIFQIVDEGGISEVEQFVDVLIGLQQSRAPGLHVILTMRSEFLGRCASFEGLAEVINETQFLLPRMNVRAMMRAIREPARIYGGMVERELAEAIVADSGRGQDHLPLMQHAMMLMQRRATGHMSPTTDGPQWFLGLAAYRESGGVARLLSEHADEVVSDIEAHVGDQVNTKQILECAFKALTDINADGHGIRRPRTVGQLMAVTGAAREVLLRVLLPLCADGVSFLKIFGQEPYGRGELVDISHEALIRNWELLAAWTTQEADNGAIYRRLVALTEEHRGDPSILLGVREARDRDRWWHEVRPSQDWADRYGYKDQQITISEVRALIDRSLDPDVQAFSFWREQMQIARLIWEKEQQTDALLQGHALGQAEHWVEARRGDITAEDLTFIEASLAERNRVKQESEARERRHQEAEMRMVDANLVTQARFMADLARQSVEQGDAVTGMLLALAGLPVPGAPPRRYVPEAERSLYAGYFTRRELAVLRGHTRPVISAAFSADGTRIVSASADKSVRVWDPATGNEIAVLKGHTGPVNSAAFSPDGTCIVSASADKTVRLWDIATMKEIAVLKGHGEAVEIAAFSPDGARIISASQDKTMRLWDAVTGKVVAVLLPPPDRANRQFGVASAAFNWNGTQIMSISQDNTLRQWDAATGKEALPLEGPSGYSSKAAFSPDGARVASASADEKVQLWDATTGYEIAALQGHTNKVVGAAFSLDGNRIVSASADATARLWNVANGKEIAVFRGHVDVVNSAVFSPDGSRIVSASDDGTVRLWDIAITDDGAVSKEHAELVNSAAFSPDGAHILSACDDGSVRLWDAANGESILVLQGHTSGVNSAAFSPDGAHVVSASGDNTARLWNAANGKPTSVLQGHAAGVNSAAFSPDGARIVSASDDRAVRLWNAATGAPIAELKGHDGWVNTAAFSPDGARIVSASDDRMLRLWDAATGKEAAVLKGHTGGVVTAAFSPDGARIASGSHDGTVRLWDSATSKMIAVLKGHTGTILSALFSPDGSRIVSASDDGTVRLWDITTRKEIAMLEGHSGEVLSTAFSQDGTRIFSVSADKTLRWWNVFPNTKALVDHVMRIVPRGLTPKQLADCFLSPEPPIWWITGPDIEADPAKWQPKWPYHTSAWRDWLVAQRHSGTSPLPHED